LGRASLAMVCMIFIVHTIAAAQHGLKMCSPDAYHACALQRSPARGAALVGSVFWLGTWLSPQSNKNMRAVCFIWFRWTTGCKTVRRFGGFLMRSTTCSADQRNIVNPLFSGCCLSLVAEFPQFVKWSASCGAFVPVSLRCYSGRCKKRL
jgi:hypothetical protein